MELLEIEKELTGPGQEQALQMYDAQLVALGTRLEAARTAGLPPDEFARCEPLAEVVTLARKLLRLKVKDAQDAQKKYDFNPDR